MAFLLADIDAALVTILEGVTGIGNVHDRDRWTNDKNEFKTRFYHAGTALINACCVTRSGYRPELTLSGQTLKRHEMKIWSVYSFKDSSDTYSAFQALIEAEVDAINAYYNGYTDAWSMFAPEGSAKATPIEIRKWAGYMVHYAEIMVTVEVRS